MNFVLRLHQLFFEREVDSLQAGLEFGKRKDALIDKCQAERRLNRMLLLIVYGKF